MVVIKAGFGGEKYKTIPGHSCLPFFSGIGDNKEGEESHIAVAGQLWRIGFI